MCERLKRPQNRQNVREVATFRTFLFLRKEFCMICRYLTYEERKKIEKEYSSGSRPCDIAKALGVHTATIYRELSRGFTGERDDAARPIYSAELAQKNIQASIRNRGHKTKTEVT